MSDPAYDGVTIPTNRPKRRKTALEDSQDTLAEKLRDMIEDPVGCPSLDVGSPDLHRNIDRHCDWKFHLYDLLEVWVAQQVILKEGKPR